MKSRNDLLELTKVFGSKN